MELFQLVVTQGVYLFDGYFFSFFPVDSQINIWSVRWYCCFFTFFEYIPQVMLFSWDPVLDVLVLVVLLVLYHQLCANVDGSQLNFVFDFIPS